MANFVCGDFFFTLDIEEIFQKLSKENTALYENFGRIIVIVKDPLPNDPELFKRTTFSGKQSMSESDEWKRDEMLAKLVAIDMDFAKILLAAAVAGDEESTMLSLIKLGVSIHQKNFTASGLPKKSLLALAVQYRRQRAVKILLENGANIQDKLNDTNLLSYAVIHGSVWIAELLLEFGADIEASADDGKTPLILALMKQNESMVELLLAHGADYRRECANGIMAFAYAVGKDDDVHCVKLLLEHVEKQEGRAAIRDYVNTASLKVDDATNHKSRLLELENERAQKNKSFPAVVTSYKFKPQYQTLVGSPKDENSPSKEETALALAVRRGHFMTAKVLLENGANVNDILGHGLKKSPLLHYAVVYEIISYDERPSSFPMVRTLLDFNVDVNASAVDFDGSTPLVFALIMQNVQMAGMLLAHGADYRHVCTNGIMTLVYAVGERDDVQCLKTLLEHVEEREGRAALVEYVNFVSHDAEAPCASTVLIRACALARYDSVKLLLAMGADATKRDLSDRTPDAYIPRDNAVKRGRILLLFMINKILLR